MPELCRYRWVLLHCASYGLCIALGIAVATWLTARELKRKGYDSVLALDAPFVPGPMPSRLG